MSDQEKKDILESMFEDTAQNKTSEQGGDDQNVSDASAKLKEVVKLEDLSEEKEYSENEFDEMVKLYEETMNEFVEGEVIEGKILSITDKEVAIDIGFKSEGSIPIEEFTDLEELKVGDDIEVFLDNIEDKEGQLVLSKKKADFMRTWDEIMSKYENKEVMQGKCVRRIKGGIVVDLKGIDAFLPGSQIDVKPIRDFDAYIGRTIDFKIVKVNHLRKNIVVSHRVLVEEKLGDQRKKILEELHVGQILEGTVKNITDFGVFIDLGGADGLLHINDLSWGRVNHPSEIVSLDEKITVKVLDFNEAKDRISLGLKQLQPHPWENIEEKYPENSVVKGKVVNISDYGAFVELEKGVEGLIHISEMSWTQHIKHPSKILAVGETVEAKILNVDQENKKISLGLKQLEPDPWNLLEEKYPVDSRHKGKVRNLTNFGAFVELEEGIDGLIHISDLSWTKKIRHPAEVVKKGDTIDVVVLSVNRENRRISLGYKQIQDNPWETFEETYQVGQQAKGKVVRLIEKGVIVELNDEVDGFIPFSHLAKPNISKPSDGYKVGDELDLIVLEFDKEAKKIVCSEKIEYAKSLIEKKAGGAGTDEFESFDESSSSGASNVKDVDDSKEADKEERREAQSDDKSTKEKAEKVEKVDESAEPEKEVESKAEKADAKAAKAEEKAEEIAEPESEMKKDAEPEKEAAAEKDEAEAKAEKKTEEKTSAKKTSKDKKEEADPEADEDEKETDK